MNPVRIDSRTESDRSRGLLCLSRSKASVNTRVLGSILAFPPLLFEKMDRQRTIALIIILYNDDGGVTVGLISLYTPPSPRQSPSFTPGKDWFRPAPCPGTHSGSGDFVTVAPPAVKSGLVASNCGSSAGGFRCVSCLA